MLASILKRWSLTVPLATAVVVAYAALAPAAASAANFVVTLAPGADATQVAARQKVKTQRTYSEAIDGYSADLSTAQTVQLAKDPLVQSVVPDSEFRLHNVLRPQVIRPNIYRIDGDLSPTAKIDGVDERVDADIAIIDSGVSPHPDLNIAGGVDCAGAGTYADSENHGTHVAGVAAAIDNSIGVVGVAPGARIWAVRVGDRKGKIKLSSLLCAVDWVARNSAVIDVANMSLGDDKGSDIGNCGVDAAGKVRDPFHQGICAGVARGVVYTVSAGNDGMDAATQTPAAYDEVITVSAYTDYDGEPGGLAQPNCFGFILPEEDDTLAAFSNYGADVDIAAPGVCIDSTIDGGYGAQSGTSFAAPHVAGGAALIKARTPWATPESVKSTLLSVAEPGPLPQDPDPTDKEPLLQVGSL